MGRSRRYSSLQRFLPASETVRAPAPGHALCLLGGGKRVRPLLAFAAGELAGPYPRESKSWPPRSDVHAYSLVHDDLPCMDNDVLRRGKRPVTSNSAGTALLVGDALQPLAFQFWPNMS
jgi:farnesyl diphosphate synthase